MKHGKLLEKASQAVNKLFSDMTVSHQETLDSLELLREELNVLIHVLEEDIEKELNFPG